MNVFSSFLTGLFFTFLLLVLCTFLVIGAKTIIIAIKNKFPSPPKQETIAPPPEQKPKRQYKRVRSIEINPDEVDRIYVKKIS